jgi:hypothetical protein
MSNLPVPLWASEPEAGATPLEVAWLTLAPRDQRRAYQSEPDHLRRADLAADLKADLAASLKAGSAIAFGGYESSGQSHRDGEIPVSIFNYPFCRIDWRAGTVEAFGLKYEGVGVVRPAVPDAKL